MKKWICWFCLVCLLVSLASCAFAQTFYFNPLFTTQDTRARQKVQLHNNSTTTAYAFANGMNIVQFDCTIRVLPCRSKATNRRTISSPTGSATFTYEKDVKSGKSMGWYNYNYVLRVEPHSSRLGSNFWINGSFLP